MRLPPPLVALTPGTLDAQAAVRFGARAEAALAAGLPGLLLREPALGERDFLALAHALAERARARGAWFCVHDRAHIALAVGADGCHLGFRSLAPAELRPHMQGGMAGSMALGLSTHATDDPQAWRQADYLFHGPLRDTPSKAGLLEPVGVAGLEQALARTDRPVLALGGVRPEDFAPVIAAGGAGVAVLRGIFGAAGSSGPADATRAFLDALPEVRT